MYTCVHTCTHQPSISASSMWCVHSTIVNMHPHVHTCTHQPSISASSMWCVHRTIVLPSLFLRRKSQICLLAKGSTPDVGSSRMMVRHLPTKASRMDSFLFMPPDRYLANLSPWPPSSTFSSHLEDRDQIKHYDLQ